MFIYSQLSNWFWIWGSPMEMVVRPFDSPPRLNSIDAFMLFTWWNTRKLIIEWYHMGIERATVILKYLCILYSFISLEILTSLANHKSNNWNKSNKSSFCDRSLQKSRFINLESNICYATQISQNQSVHGNGAQESHGFRKNVAVITNKKDIMNGKSMIIIISIIRYSPLKRWK